MGLRISGHNQTPYMDWHPCVQKDNVHGYDILIIPENTLLFKGVNTIPKPIRADKKTSPGSYFGNLSVAAYYAFSSDMIQGEHGKVITYRTTKPIYVLDMTSINNYRKLYQHPIPESMGPNSINILTYTFGYTPEKEQLRRCSHLDIDSELVKWLYNLNLKDIDGYGYLKLPGFHSEIMIFNTQTEGIFDYKDKMELYPLEYRFVSYYNTNVIIETWKGDITGKELSFEQLSSDEIKVSPKYNMTWIYDPTQKKSQGLNMEIDAQSLRSFHNRSDSFLCKEPFVSLRQQHLIKYQHLTSRKTTNSVLNNLFSLNTINN